MIDFHKILSIGDKADLRPLNVRKLKEDEKVPTYPSRILDIKDGNVLQLTMPFVDGRVVPLAVNEKFEICVYTKNGLYKCDSVIVARYKENNMFFLDAAVYTSFTKVQRRAFYRYTYRTGVEYRVVSQAIAMGAEKESPEVSETAEWKSGIMIDLSGGGVRMVTDGQEEKGSYIAMRFNIKRCGTDYPVFVYAEVLRTFRMENNPKLQDVRIEFMNIDDKLRERIVSFIFEEERKALSSGKK